MLNKMIFLPFPRSFGYDPLPIPEAAFGRMGRAVKRCLEELPWLRPLDAIVLTGEALAHGQLYQFHPTETNLRREMLHRLDLAGVGVVVLGAPFYAQWAGLQFHDLSHLRSEDFESFWDDILPLYASWWQEYLRAGQTEKVGGILAQREREVVRQMRWVRDGSKMRLHGGRLDRNRMHAFLRRHAGLPKAEQRDDPDKDIPVLREWFELVQRQPEWDIDDVMLVNADHTLSFDLRPVTAKGRPRGSGLPGLFAQLFEKSADHLDEATLEEADHIASKKPSPAEIAVAAEMARLLRDAHGAARDLPLMDEIVAESERGLDARDAAVVLPFVREVALRTSQLRDRATQAAVLYNLGGGHWNREDVAKEYGTTPGKMRSREGPAEDLIAASRRATG